MVAFYMKKGTEAQCPVFLPLRLLTCLGRCHGGEEIAALRQGKATEVMEPQSLSLWFDPSIQAIPEIFLKEPEKFDRLRLFVVHYIR